MTLNGSQGRRDAPSLTAPATLNGGHQARDTHKRPASASWALVKLCADSVDDLERTRIATENRVRSLREVKGLEGSPEEQRMTQMVADLAKIEHMAVKELERAMKRHPLAGWIADTKGIGYKQAARLIAEIGDPLSYIDGETGEVIPRTVSKLWAYCGYRPGQKRKKGEQSNWNAKAKMRAYLIAESCMKNRSSPYRQVYEDARTSWAERETSDGHKHNHALRVVAKEVLKDIWRASRGETGAIPTPTISASRPSLNGAIEHPMSKTAAPR